VDTLAWLNSTISRPFAKPETGKIAVKVISHYGDAVLNTFNV
jgi:adenine-specific DNA-methyltransferase